jgi:hypothetical protein
MCGTASRGEGGALHCIPFGMVIDDPAAALWPVSHLCLFPLRPIPTWARSHLGPFPIGPVPACAQVVCTGWVIRPRRNITEVSDKKCQAAFVALARPKEGECAHATHAHTHAHTLHRHTRYARARRWADDRRVAAPRLLHESRSAARAAAAGLTPYPSPSPTPAAAAPVQGCARMRRNAARMHASRARACRWSAAAAAAGGRAEEDVRAGRRDAPTGNARADACARGWTRARADGRAVVLGWLLRRTVGVFARLHVVRCPLHAVRCMLHAVRCTLSVARCPLHVAAEL